MLLLFSAKAWQMGVYLRCLTWLSLTPLDPGLKMSLEYSRSPVWVSTFRSVFSFGGFLAWAWGSIGYIALWVIACVIKSEFWDSIVCTIEFYLRVNYCMVWRIAGVAREGCVKLDSLSLYYEFSPCFKRSVSIGFVLVVSIIIWPMLSGFPYWPLLILNESANWRSGIVCLLVISLASGLTAVSGILTLTWWRLAI